jgi:hypothetical protein
LLMLFSRCPASTTTPAAGTVSADGCSLLAPGWGAGPNGVELCECRFVQCYQQHGKVLG